MKLALLACFALCALIMGSQVPSMPAPETMPEEPETEASRQDAKALTEDDEYPPRGPELTKED